MLLRLSLCFICLLGFTSPASAQICTMIARAGTLEAELLDTGQGTRPFDVRTLAAIQLNARTLSGYFVSDPLLADALTAYARNVAALRRDPAGHRDAAHVALVQYLLSTSGTHCEDAEINPALSLEQLPEITTDRRAILRAVDLATAFPIVALLLAKLCFGAIIYRIVTRRRAAHRIRHTCLVDVEITSDETRFTSKMIDISALGAKIRLPRKTKLADSASLSFNGQSFNVRLAWQNSHFAGVRFKRPLHKRLIALVSKGVQDRQKPPVALPAAGAPTPAND